MVTTVIDSMMDLNFSLSRTASSTAVVRSRVRHDVVSIVHSLVEVTGVARNGTAVKIAAKRETNRFHRMDSVVVANG